MRRILFSILFLACLAGCRSTRRVTPSSTLIPTTSSVPTRALNQTTTATKALTSKPTASPTPTRTVLPTPTPSLTQSPEPTQTALPTRIPTITPTRLGLPPATPTPNPLPVVTLVDTQVLSTTLLSALTMQEADHLVRVTGWPNGWRDGCGTPIWLDDEHLLAYAVTGEYESYGTYQMSLPVLINLARGTVRLPVTGGPTEHCDRVIWSQQYQRLLALQVGETQVIDFDGNILYRLPGGDADGVLSPSGRRLVTGSILIDLKTLDVQHGVSLPGDWFGDPAWSKDETRVFRCCFGYADFTRKIYKSFRLEIEQEGRDCVGEFGCIGSLWIDATRVFVFWDFWAGDRHMWGAIVNPVKQTYLNPRPTNAPPYGENEGDCIDWLARVSPDWQYSAISCGQQTYWMNLLTTATYTSTASARWADWSPDSQYLLLVSNLEKNTQRGQYWLQPVKGGSPIPLAEAPAFSPVWQGKRAFYLAGTNDALNIFDLRTHARQQIPLPKAVDPTMNWSLADQYVTFLSQDRQALITIPTSGSHATQITLTQLVTTTVYTNLEGKYMTFISDDRLTLFTLNVTTGDLQTYPLERPVGNIIWSADPALYWVSADGQTMARLDVAQGKLDMVSFPTPIYQVFQQPDGEQVLAQGIDGSLWWTPDIQTGTVRLISARVPDVRSVHWSPSGKRIAFLSTVDLYVADVTDK